MEEKFPPVREGEGERDQPPYGLFSCWACLKRAFPWRRLRGRGGERWHKLKSASIALRFGHRRRLSPGSCRYDPLSYAQNFEEKAFDEDNDDNFYRGFSSRFVLIAQATTVNPPERN